MCDIVLHNENYKDDIETNFQLTRIILSVLGIWPNLRRERSICEKMFKLLRIFVAYAVLYSALVPGALFWIFEKRARVRLKMATVILYGSMNIFKYYKLIVQEDRIKRCLKLFETDWKNVDNVGARSMMLESARIGKRLIIICGSFLFSSGVAFRTLIPLSKGKIVTPENITIRPLPYPVYLFSLNVQSSPTYEIVYTSHCLSGIVTVSISTGLYGLIITFVMHSCGQLKILVNLINGLVEKQQQNELDVNSKLSVIVEHQIRIRSFLHLVENTLHQAVLVEVSGSTIIICIVCYCILMEWENSNAIAMCSYFITLSTALINMFMFCYTGQQLITQIIKTSVAYFNVLRSVTD